jgi:ribonuclease HII
MRNSKISNCPHHSIWLDEVGRWPLAGPVAVGGVLCLPDFFEWCLPSRYNDITDSKKLSPRQREYLSWCIKDCSDIIYATSSVSGAYIDRYGIVAAIRKASLDVIRQIIKQVTPLLWVWWECDLRILLDGKTDYGLSQKITFPLQTIVRWDASVREIGAASIIAKVERDAMMMRLSQKKKYSIYGFHRHKWYGTLFHRQMIESHGLSDIHRVSFCKSIIIRRTNCD